MTFKEIRDSNRLLYEYIRGSRLFGLDTPESDIDTGGIFIGPNEWFLGMGDESVEFLKSDRNDDSWYEIKKYFQLISKSSPETLESLFIPPEKILVKNPLMDLLLENRDKFLTKECFPTFSRYAISQIHKSVGQNKAMMIDPTKVEFRKTPLEFCHMIIDGRKTKRLSEWLQENGLSESKCGLSRLENFTEGYVLYYSESLPYRGILSKSDPETTQLRLSRIPKGEEPLGVFQFNPSTFVNHCKEYKRYHDWVKNRNKSRFDLNKGYTFDCYLDSDTEFLTNRGWMKYDDVKDDDLVGCFSNSHILEYQPIISRTDKIYSGEIYSYESNNIKFSVTPNHNLYLFSNNKWELIPIKDLNERFTYVQVDSLEDKSYSTFSPKRITRNNVYGCRIVCFETKYGTLITRNHGKLSFNGNSKNMTHCVRLLTQSIEIAEGKGLILDRRDIDRDFLLSIKNHEITYEEVIKYTENLENKMKKAFQDSKIPDRIDNELLEKLLLEIRENWGK